MKFNFNQYWTTKFPIQEVPETLYPGHEADQSPVSSIEVKNKWSFTFMLYICLHGMAVLDRGVYCLLSHNVTVISQYGLNYVTCKQQLTWKLHIYTECLSSLVAC